MKKIDETNRATGLVYVLVILVIIAILQAILANFINQKWLKERDSVSCIPQTETHYPGYYLQSAAHPINNEAKLQNFMEQYIILTRNEIITDFYKVSKNPKYEKARLSSAKFKAINMSKGLERKLNSVRYARSNETYNYLEQEGLNIVFLVDEIITAPVPAGMNIPITVRGQYDAIYDKSDKDKKNLPPKFLGYREIKYLVELSFPLTDINESFENKPGFYVVWSEERTLSPGEKNKLEKRSRTIYLEQD